MKHDRQISDALGSCGTDVLSSEIVQSYFFFTFVRDPIERFYSGLQQAMRRNRSVRLSMSNETSARSFIESVARRFSTKSSLLDQHLESQSLSLSSPVLHSQEVPMHFIGRTEYLLRDLHRLWDYLQFNWNSSLPQLPSSIRTSNAAKQNLKVYVDRVRDAKSDNLIAFAWKQDMVCFS